MGTPYFGHYVAEADYGLSGNYITGCKFHCSEAGKAYHLDVYIKRENAGKIKFALYDQSLNFVAETPEWTITSPWDGWKKLTFVTPPDLTVQDYWICTLRDANQIFKKHAGTINQTLYKARNYVDGFPASISSPTYENFEYSSYCNYDIPVDTTQAASGIGGAGATLNGDITDLKGINCSKRGFEWQRPLSPTAKGSIANFTYAHGYCYYDGYLYGCQRFSPGKVVKILATDYTTQSSLTPQHNATNADVLHDIKAFAGYIWTCDGDGWLYKIDPATFTVVGAWQLFAEYTQGMCYDGTYIWVSGNSGELAKFKVSDNSHSSNDTGLGEYHAIVEDGDYIYVNDTTNKDLRKFRKSDWWPIASVALGVRCTDDMAQDNTYVYLGADVDPGSLIRVQKSDMSKSSVSPERLGQSYGVFKINDGVADRIVSLDQTHNWLWIFATDLTVRRVVGLTGLDTSNGVNELAEDASGYLHLTHYNPSSPTRIIKLEKSDVMPANAEGYIWSESNSYGIGPHSHAISNLTTGITYRYKAKAYNPLGWGYGDYVEFTPTALKAGVGSNAAKLIGARLL